MFTAGHCLGGTLSGCQAVIFQYSDSSSLVYFLNVLKSNSKHAQIYYNELNIIIIYC